MSWRVELALTDVFQISNAQFEPTWAKAEIGWNVNNKRQLQGDIELIE